MTLPKGEKNESEMMAMMIKGRELQQQKHSEQSGTTKKLIKTEGIHVAAHGSRLLFKRGYQNVSMSHFGRHHFDSVRSVLNKTTAIALIVIACCC